jgi:CRP/FNR family transcriptional regulator, polysaccharide utilization system transcription regulator
LVFREHSIVRHEVNPVTTETAIHDALTDIAAFESYPAGRVIFRDGEEPRGIYILESGQVDLIYASRNGHTKPLRVATEGQILGVSDVVARRSHDCTATCSTSVDVGFIPRDEFLRVLDTNPAVWFRVLQLLSEDVNSCYDCMRSIAAVR